MSRLIEKLNNLDRASMPSIGFKKSDVQEQTSAMLLIVMISGRTEAETKELGNLDVAGTVLDPSSMSASNIAKYMKNRGNMPAGLLMEGDKSLNGLKTDASEVDYIIYQSGVAANVFGSSDFTNAGRILAIKPAIETSLLMAVNSLHPSIDAILIDLKDNALTIEDLLNCQRISDHTVQPLIAVIGNKLTRPELTALRDAGIKCLLAQPGVPLDDLKEMLDSIRQLPRPVKKKERGGTAILPRLDQKLSTKEEDGEGDDDD